VYNVFVRQVGTTPLMIAAQNNHLEVVRALVKHKDTIITTTRPVPAPCFLLMLQRISIAYC
jgi:hypothetical protein